MEVQSFCARWIVVAVVLAGCFFSQCGEKKQEHRSLRIKKMTKVVSPANGAKLTLNDDWNFAVEPAQDTVSVDSFTVNIGTTPVFSSAQKKPAQPYPFVGRHNITYAVYLSNGKKEVHTQSVTLLAPQEPEAYTYRKQNTFTHDPDAFIQGLFYENGFLYESTGHRGESTLRKVNPGTGSVVQKIDLEQEYFGEGITAYKDEIYMLTWESRKGFVYDKKDFKLLREFGYPTEGWGITTMGDTLVMSDGSENLYLMDPASFTQLGRLQVYDHEGAVKGLNELEYIDGKIYANIYQTDYIAIIDASTGAVTGKINLAGIFDRNNYGRRSDVLNGIAYNPDNKHLYVTGKWWPKLYEIEIIKTETPIP